MQQQLRSRCRGSPPATSTPMPTLEFAGGLAMENAQHGRRLHVDDPPAYSGMAIYTLHVA